MKRRKQLVKHSIPDIGKQHLGEIQNALDKIRDIILKDNFNLSRDDQDAIEVKLKELKQYIQDKYEEHSPKQ